MQQNAAAALRIASELDVSEAAARQALARFGGLQGRGEIFTTKSGVTIIDDAYNASPASMRAGLSVLSELRGERKIAVLADMLELGEREESYHRELGKLISELHIDVLFLYGRLAALIGESVQQYGDMAGHKPAISYFTDLTELRNTVCSVAHTGDVLLFKGSNSMRLSDIVSELRKERE